MTAPITGIYVDECPLVALPAPKGIGRSVITPMTEFERIMGQGRGTTSAGLAPNGSLTYDLDAAYRSDDSFAEAADLFLAGFDPADLTDFPNGVVA